jgi:hypothetical protein
MAFSYNKFRLFDFQTFGYLWGITCYNKWHLENTWIESCRLFMTESLIFLGAIAKLRKATVTLVMSVCLSVCLRVCLHGTTRIPLDEFDISLFRKYVEKIQVSLKSDKNYGHFTWRRIKHLWYLLEFFLEWEMFWTKVVEKVTIYFMFNNVLPTVVPCMR